MTSNSTANGGTVQNEGTSRRALLKGAVAAGVGAAVYASPVVSKVPAYAAHGLSTISSTSSILCMGFSPNHANNTGDWHLSLNFPTNVTPPSTAVELPTPFQANAFLKADGFDNASWATGDHRGDGVPAQIGNSGFGIFHPNSPIPMTNVTGVTESTGVTLRLRYWVGGAWREVHVTGHPNNMGTVTQDGNKNEPDGNQNSAAGWGGGGMGLKLLDPNCQIEMVNWHNGATTGASSLQPGTCSMSGSVILARPLSSDNVPILGPDAPPDNVPNPWQGDPNRWRFFHSGAGSKSNVAGRSWVGGFTFRISCR